MNKSVKKSVSFIARTVKTISLSITNLTYLKRLHESEVFFVAFLPPLRHFVTPLLKERLVWLLSRGAVNNVDCGVVHLMATTGRPYNTDIFYVFLPPLRHFVIPLLKERLIWIPLRGAGDAVDCGVALSVSF